MWKFLVKNQSIEILEREVLADHQIQYVQFRFVFDGDWKRFHKVVQFSQCDENYNIVLGVDGTSLYLPAELHVGAAKMSVFGYDTESDTTVRATTVPVTLNIRHSGFVGDDDPPIPPTLDLYAQLLKRIEDAEKGLDCKSAFEIAVEHGYVGTEEEWLASLHGADGKDGKDGETPDMSEYQKTSEVTQIVDREIEQVVEDFHTHPNKETLDAITPELFGELGGLQQFEDETKYEIHTLNEALDNFSRTAYTHENKDTLDDLTPELLTLLQGLQQYEDQTAQDMQTIRESVEPVVSQAHWHHNLTVLNSITQAKINEWDSIATLKTQLNALSTELTVFKGKCDNNAARIGVNETDIDSIQATLVDLQAQIDALKNNGYTVLFECGAEVPEKYGILLGFVVNGGFRTLTNMRSQFPNFCSETNNYALFYDQEDFNWDAQVLTCVEQRIKLTSDSKIQFCYNSGATEDGMLYLINPPGGKIDVPITLYARSEIEYGRAIQLDFQWLQTQKIITTETDCTGIQPGEYYLCWVGRSKNTHPIIRSVKVKEVEA